jgi:serine/threonine protein kinase
LRRDGYVKVLDFGLAKLLEHNNTDSTAVTTFQTQPGILIGTPNYISPEQVEGEHVDARTDLFSLGSLLYESLTAKPAFHGGKITETIAQIVHFTPASSL